MTNLKRAKGNPVNITQVKCFNLFIAFPGYKEIKDIHEMVVKDLSFSQKLVILSFVHNRGNVSDVISI